MCSNMSILTMERYFVIIEGKIFVIYYFSKFFNFYYWIEILYKIHQNLC